MTSTHNDSQDVTAPWESLMETKLLLTVIEAAELLGISRTAIYLLLQRGEIPSVKIGRSRRIKRIDLESYVGRLADDYSGRDFGSD